MLPLRSTSHGRPSRPPAMRFPIPPDWSWVQPDPTNLQIVLFEATTQGQLSKPTPMSMAATGRAGVATTQTSYWVLMATLSSMSSTRFVPVYDGYIEAFGNDE